MNREEEMWKALEEEHGELSKREYFVTLSAMEWADNNPKEGLVSLEKAIKWLLNIDYDDLRYRDFNEGFNEELFANEFRKAMEE